jgi:CRP-like cAMP-binding protein
LRNRWTNEKGGGEANDHDNENLWQAEAVVVRLTEHPFLQGLNRGQLLLLADCALTTRFKAGEIIFRQGEKADRFYLIEQGKVVLESDTGGGESVVIDTIGAGDLLGWSWMMPPYVWHFTARAIEPTEAINFAGDILHEYCNRDHSLGFELHKRMSAVMMKRLQAARKKMLAIHAGEKLQPAIGLSPFMEQEFDIDGYPNAS